MLIKCAARAWDCHPLVLTLLAFGCASNRCVGQCQCARGGEWPTSGRLQIKAAWVLNGRIFR
eukprot:197142-Alexandrium_andersonii.AAC.1